MLTLPFSSVWRSYPDNSSWRLDLLDEPNATFFRRAYHIRTVIRLSRYLSSPCLGNSKDATFLEYNHKILTNSQQFLTIPNDLSRIIRNCREKIGIIKNLHCKSKIYDTMESDSCRRMIQSGITRDIVMYI